MSFEQQYLDLIRNVIENGSRRMDRTGVGTRALFGGQIRHDLSDGLPLLTTKKVAWKTSVKEILWMLKGGDNIRDLLQQDVHIWSEWPHAAYVRATGDAIELKAFEQRILADDAFAERWGHLPNGYGSAWRRWKTADGREIDQISKCIDTLRKDPYSRRNLWSGWNVGEIESYTLPPCHFAYSLHVADGKLTMTNVMRSVDLGLGIVFNALNLAVMTHIIAREVGLEPGSIVMSLLDLHVYENHVEGLREQLTRTPRAAPKLEILRQPASIFDYTIDDFAITGYDPHPAIKLAVAV